MTRLSTFAPALLFLMLLAIPAYSQYIESVEEITAGNFLGFGARQMAMGGTGMMANDGTALFYNPANLARIPRIEFLFGMTNQRYRDSSFVRPIRKIVDYNQVIPSVSIYGSRFEGFTPVASRDIDSKSNARINSAIISIPYPTYRGSMVLSFGVVRSSDFDKVFNFYHQDVSDSGVISATGQEFQSGGLYQWGAGLGVDLSPNVSFGITALLYSGKHEYNFGYSLDSVNIVTPWQLQFRTQQFIEDKYLGFGAKAGLAMQMTPNVGLAIAVESPVSLRVEESSDDTYDLFTTDSGAVSSENLNYVEYHVKRPFVFSAGTLLTYGDATLAADVDYTDWTQLSYSDNTAMELHNAEIKSYYTDALRFRTGAEYVFPGIGLSLRGGFFTDPLPFKSQFQNRSRKGFTLGAGILVDQVMTIDFAFLHGSFSRNSDFTYSTKTIKTPPSSPPEYLTHYLTIDEDINYNRLFLTAAYRF